jgi:hypothetical protein
VSSFQCVSTFQRLFLNFLPCFTQPSGESFLALAAAWVLAVGPRTVTNLVRTLGRSATKSHDAYQYFFSEAVWIMDEVWKILFGLILASRLIPHDALIELAGDDTLVHHSGRKIFGAGIFRDAVRSTKKQVAYACGHNWVILCVIVPVPFCPNVFVSLPVGARLRPKPPKIKGARSAKRLRPRPRWNFWRRCWRWWPLGLPSGAFGWLAMGRTPAWRRTCPRT